MPRKIKFRGKRLDTGEWVYGDYYKDMGRHVICAHGKDNPHFSIHFYVDPNTVGQFTGLKDKNSTEIFEGDILGQPSTANPNKYEVSFADGSWFAYKLGGKDNQPCERERLHEMEQCGLELLFLSVN